MQTSLTALTLAAALMLAGAAHAQTTAAPDATTAPNPASPTGATPAAPGDSNQAVRTQPTDTAQPAHGANSFTHGQAVGRLHKHGYTNIKGLKKDSNGVWRGSATKDGADVGVWLDYKGNVGQQ